MKVKVYCVKDYTGDQIWEKFFAGKFYDVVLVLGSITIVRAIEDNIFTLNSVFRNNGHEVLKSLPYFDNHFVSLKESRKLKIEKLYEKECQI